MGSDGKRRDHDKVRISRPLSAGDGGSGISGGSGASAPNDINNICPPAFRLALTEQRLRAGTELALSDKMLTLAAAPDTEVGRLTAAQFKMIQTCSDMGISYKKIHVVVGKEGKRYAELSQQ